MSDVKVRQIGHLASNPELTYVGSGENRLPRATMVVISNKRLVNRETGEQRERSTSVRWTLWRDQAENAAKYLRKGSHVSIDGRMENNNYEKDGDTVYSDQYVCEEIEYLDSKAEAEARSARSAETAAA